MADKADEDSKVMAAKPEEDAKVMAAKAEEDGKVMTPTADDEAEKMAAKGDENAKIVNDPIYGTIHIDFLAVKIIDTKYFQRLRYIKQLAFADFVYPGATHTRFAHSIGVYHLARQMIKEIEAHQLPEKAAQMSPADKRCIRVAALCHDLGHGPFSHLYEQIGKSILEKKIEDIDKKFKHEKISQFLVEKMFEEYNLKQYLGPKPDERIALIKHLIERERDLTEEENLKKYMFQIVSNKESGVDVDKWDYFKRDAIACGVPESFQYDRALSMARVVETKSNVFELGYRDYDAFNMYNMFNTRFTLYRKVYKHKVVQAVDLMVTDACRFVCDQGTNTADRSTNIELYPITSQADKNDSKNFMMLDDNNYLDVKKFLILRDDVLLKILDSSATCKKASDLIQRLHERKLYKLIFERCVKVPQRASAKTKLEDTKKQFEANLEQLKRGDVLAKKRLEECLEELKRELEMLIPKCESAKKKLENIPQSEPSKKMTEDEKKKLEESLDQFKTELEMLVPQSESSKKMAEDEKKQLEERLNGLKEEVEVLIVGFDYGKAQMDPVQNLHFYVKDKQTEGRNLEKDEVSLVLPSNFQEYHVRVYEKFTGKNYNSEYKLELREKIQKIFDRNDYETRPKDGEQK